MTLASRRFSFCDVFVVFGVLSVDACGAVEDVLSDSVAIVSLIFLFPDDVGNVSGIDSGTETSAALSGRTASVEDETFVASARVVDLDDEATADNEDAIDLDTVSSFVYRQPFNKTRRFFFLDRISSASEVTSGAMIPSVNNFQISIATCLSTLTLKAKITPNAKVRSHVSVRR